MTAGENSTVVADRSAGQKPAVSIIILNFNGGEDTLRCLSSVAATWSDHSFEVIVLDNGSTDDSVAAIRREYPHVRLIESDSNLGFSKGANLGAANANGEYLAFLNNDLRVDPGWLNPLVAALASDPSLGGVGATIMNWEGSKVEFAGRPTDAFGLAYIPSENPPPDRPQPNDGLTLFASGGACLYRKSVFDEAGGFDPDFFLYQEDVDLGWRAWILGHRIALSSKSIVYHKGGGSSRSLDPSLIQTMSMQHVLASVFKNAERHDLEELLPLVLTYLRIRTAASSNTAIFESAVGWLSEHVESLISKRRLLETSRRLSDKEVFASTGHPFAFLSRDSSLQRLVDTNKRELDLRFDPRSAESTLAALAAWEKSATSLVDLVEDTYAIKAELEKRMTDLETSWRDERLAEKDAAIKYLQEKLVDGERRIQVLEEQQSQTYPNSERQLLEENARYAEFARIIADISRELGLSNPLYDPRQVRQPTIPTNSSLQSLQAFPPTKYDVVCFSIIDWEFRWQRPQQIISQFADHGHRVFYLSISRSVSTGGPRCNVRPLRDNVWEVQLSLPKRLDVYGGELSRELMVLLLEDLKALRNTFHINTAVSIVQVATWSTLAYSLRTTFGWPIVYDCMDEWDTFPGMSQSLVTAERRLVRDADLLVVTAQKLFDKYSPQNSRTLLVRNATNFELFQAGGANDLLNDVPHPIIGYFGAIADWFDVELMVRVCRARPTYSFVFLGGVFDVPLKDLQDLTNVFLLGQQPYGTMPQYLWHFDVCIIPFKVNAVTEATDPVKFYEYVSQGKPVVTTRMPELLPYSELLYMAEGVDDFVGKLDRAVRENDTSLIERRIELARENRWETRYEALDEGIRQVYPKASVVIVTYNNLSISQQCLDSVFANTQYPNLEVIVVDNGSSDGTPQYLSGLQKEHPELKVVLNHENKGFAKANNQGLQFSSGDFLVLLNNDTVVPSGWLSKLLLHLRDPQIGLVNSVTNFSGNESRIDVTYTDLGAMEQFAEEYTREHAGEIFDIRVAAMYCVALRRDTWERVGPLDENFGIGMFEDDDYSHRTRIAGYRVVCAEDVFVHHYGQASFKKLSPHEYQEAWDKNQAYFQQKWGMSWKPHEPRRLHGKTSRLPERLAVELFFTHLTKKQEIVSMEEKRHFELGQLHSELAAAQARTDDVRHLLHLEQQKLQEIHQSRFWRLASKYWSLLRLLKGERLPPRPLPRITSTVNVRAEEERKPVLARAAGVLKKIRPRERESAAASAANKIAPSTTASTRVLGSTPRQGNKFDLLCFPIIDWNFRKQRPQQMMLEFAAFGHRVFYVSHKTRGKGDPYEIRRLAEGIFEVSLLGPPRDPYVQTMTPKDRDNFAQVLDVLRREQSVFTAVIIVELPFWGPLAARLRTDHAWPVIYDCMDNLAGFSSNTRQMLGQESDLLTSADLVTVSSLYLEHFARDRNPNVLLLRNGCDYAHFSKINTSSPHQKNKSRPLIGYYGAIADWFDAQLVADVARRHPEWDFILIGSTVLADVSRLRRLRNVAFAGERPYEELPEWLERFDVGIIPFKLTPLTEATNPVKVYEMLAAGKPIVSVPLPEVAVLTPLVRVASTAEEFEKEIGEAIEYDYEAWVVAKRQRYASENTWRARLETLLPRVEEIFPVVSAVLTAADQQSLEKVLDDSSRNNEWPSTELIVIAPFEAHDAHEKGNVPAEGIPKTRWIASDGRSWSNAANEVLSTYSGDYVMFASPGVSLSPGALHGMSRRLQGDLAIGMVALGSLSDAADEPQPASPAGWMMRRDVLEEVGKFDEQFDSCFYALLDLVQRAKSAGYQIAPVVASGQAAPPVELSTHPADRERFTLKWFPASSVKDEEIETQPAVR